MQDIRDTLASLTEQDLKTFLTIRTAMRRAYLMAIAATVGMQAYSSEDDSFCDAIDIKVEMLMRRAGITTQQNENNKPEENMHDPFAVMTRPIPAAPVTDIIKHNNATNVTAWPTSNAQHVLDQTATGIK